MKPAHQMTKMELLREDFARDRAVLKVKKRVIAILGKLPDDDARRRVLAATAIMLGLREP